MQGNVKISKQILPMKVIKQNYTISSYQVSKKKIISPNHNKVYRTHDKMPEQTKIHKFF